MNDEDKIQDIERKIKREEALLTAANVMRQQTNNESVHSKIDTQIRDARRNIDFFQQRLRELKVRSLGSGMDNMSLGGSTLASRPRSADLRNDSHAPPTPPPKDASGYGLSHHDLMPAQGPFPGQPPNSSIPKARPNFTKLGAHGRSTGPPAPFVLTRNTRRPYQIRFALSWTPNPAHAVTDSVQA